VNEPDWLGWAREILATAQTGLAFTRDPYDAQRYQALYDLAARIMQTHTGAPLEHIENLLAGETGYATPKIGVRAAVFDRDGRILMVRETSDNGSWSLPGGWADVNQTLSYSAEREVREETGYIVRATKLAAAWDRTTQGHPPAAFSICKFFFLCALEGGAPATSLETSEIAWFTEAELPTDISIRRVLPRQIARMFAHWRDPTLPTEFD